jgi:D-amino-acid dehydrogenase
MARTDVIVLGAGIVGTSIALHLAKRGLSVVLVDRRGPGEETSYGNAGVIEGNTLFPHAFPSGLALLRIALKRAPEANFDISFLPRIAPWLLSYRANTRLAGRIAFAEAMRPLFSRAVSEHEELMAESGATRYLRKDGWIKLYRSDKSFEGTVPERALAQQLGLPHRVLTGPETRALEPSLQPVFRSV